MPDSPFYQVLLEDHERTRSLLSRIRQALTDNKDTSRIRHLANALHQELISHYLLEEHALFPVLTQYRPMTLMEVEHDHLTETQDRLNQLLDSNADTPDLASTLDVLEEQLLGHMKEEEHGLFPMADAWFEPEEKAMVRRKLAEVHALIQDPVERERLRQRPIPSCTVSQIPLFQPPQKAVQYRKLANSDHASLHLVTLQAGESLKRHWSPEVQTMLVLSGQVDLITDSQRQTLGPGSRISINPRCQVGLTARSDAELIVMKVWPRPHFLRR